jgi:hypothetical protein
MIRNPRVRIAAATSIPKRDSESTQNPFFGMVLYYKISSVPETAVLQSHGK